MKKVFISGKITGEPINECYRKFVLATMEIHRQFKDYSILWHNIINPLGLDGIHFGIDHDKAMKICRAELKTCTHIYMLKDWKKSKGAKDEHQFAVDNGIEIIYE